MADIPARTERIQAVQTEVVEQFAALCAAPDDAGAAAAADHALAALEELLIAEGEGT